MTTTLSARARRKLLFSPRFAELAGSPLTYLDVGARGDLDEPWSLMPAGSLEVVGFEPDAAECEKLNADVPTNRSRRYLPAALWSQDGMVEFHINAVPSTSSVYPANMEDIRRFHARHWKVRETARVVSAQATTLDAVVAQNGLSPDFLKLDTQGAELPILQGAAASLKEIVAVTAETWMTEVYKGQALGGEILCHMQNAGFTVFDFNVAAAWNSTASEHHGLQEKMQLVGQDFLFIRSDFSSLPRGKIIKAAAIADVFGFPGAGVVMLDDYLKANPGDQNAASARDFIIDRSRVRFPRLSRAGRILKRLVGRRESDFARIH